MENGTYRGDISLILFAGTLPEVLRFIERYFGNESAPA